MVRIILGCQPCAFIVLNTSLYYPQTLCYPLRWAPITHTNTLGEKKLGKEKLKLKHFMEETSVLK